MAEKDLFMPGCFTYVTVGDIRHHILGNDFEDRHLGRLPIDTIMAKIIWTTEACDLLHRFTPLEDEDIFRHNQQQKGKRKTKVCHDSQSHYGENVGDDDVFISSPKSGSPKPSSSNNYLDTISDISDNDRFADVEDNNDESEPAGSPTEKVEDIPTCSGLRPGEIMIPAGYEDSGEETDIYCIASESDCELDNDIL